MTKLLTSQTTGALNTRVLGTKACDKCTLDTATRPWGSGHSSRALAIKLWAFACGTCLALAGCSGPPLDTAPIRFVDAFEDATVQGTPAAKELYGPTAWVFDEGTEGWTTAAGGLEARDGALHLQAGPRSALTVRVETEAPEEETVHAIEVSARISAGSQLSIRFASGEELNLPATLNSPFGAFNTPIKPGTEMQIYSIQPSQTVRASDVNHLILVPTDAEEAEVAVDSVRLIFRGEHLASIDAGVSWQGLSERYRESVVARAPETIELTRTLPANAIFNTSVGTLASGPVTFTATVTTNGAEDRVAEVTVDEADSWNPLVLDLGDWSGKEVTLRLALQGAEGDVGLWGSPVVRSRNNAGEKPQGVILVIADTMRRDHLELYGYERATAPKISALARAGVSFSDAISQATWTKVSVPAIQTSLYPTTHTIEDIPDRLPASAQTLAEVYREAGYSTLALTTIPFVGRLTALHQGYEEFHEGGSVDDDLGPKSAAEHVSRLEAWLEERGDAPFFVLLHIADAHSPYRPLSAYDTTFAEAGEMDRLDELIEQVKPEITHNPLMQRFGMPRREELARAGIDPEDFVRLEQLGYDSSIRGLDDAIGHLTGVLDRLGLTDDTLMGFVSDHGTEFLEHDAHFHGHTAYGELNQVPLFFWGPSFVTQPQSVGATVQTIDLMPTLLELSGLPVPDAAQGQSLLPFFSDPDSPWDRPAITELPMNMRDVPATSIIQDGWKLIEYKDPDGPRHELFSHRDDPLNLTDVAGENPDIVAKLSRVLGNWRKFAEAAKLSQSMSTESMSAAELERLRSLGYI